MSDTLQTKKWYTIVVLLIEHCAICSIFDADGQPLCEGCYHESFNDIKEKQVEKIYEYCKDKGISIDELKIH